jgi:hypothetical protein
MAALNLLALPPAEAAVLEAEAALMLGQIMGQVARQALLVKVMLAAVGSILQALMAVAAAGVLEPLVQVAQVLLAVMVAMVELPLFLELLHIMLAAAVVVVTPLARLVLAV